MQDHKVTFTMHLATTVQRLAPRQQTHGLLKHCITMDLAEMWGASPADGQTLLTLDPPDLNTCILHLHRLCVNRSTVACFAFNFRQHDSDAGESRDSLAEGRGNSRANGPPAELLYTAVATMLGVSCPRVRPTVVMLCRPLPWSAVWMATATEIWELRPSKAESFIRES